MMMLGNWYCEKDVAIKGSDRRRYLPVLPQNERKQYVGHQQTTDKKSDHGHQ